MEEYGPAFPPVSDKIRNEKTDKSRLARRPGTVLDPHELYELSDDLPELGRPVLVQALTGFVDAGSATRLAREHLLTSLDAQLIATFDADQLIDYRSRRPVMIFVEDHWEDYDEPVLGLHLLRDDAGTPFLLLAGPEPDLQWERFTAAVLAVADRLGVHLTVGLNSIPMAVPHTRPTGITAHATRRDLISGYEPWLQRVQVPGSAGHLIEYRRGQLGRDAIGFAVHVPHYLAQTEYPTAAELLLTSVSRATGLLLPTEGLHSAAELIRADIDTQIAQAEEAGALVRALEQQYDAFVRGRQGTNLLATDSGPLPTADELGAELERFLAEHSKPGDPPTG
jgi:predicted ATP-grasp superfamily ATP-dependent carboligase